MHEKFLGDFLQKVAKKKMYKNKNIGVVIVAGGSGSRMGADVPKQFLRLDGEPILAVTLRRFLPYADHIVVVLPEAQQGLWRELAEECNLWGTHSVCAGGATRFHSVQNGLKALGEGCDIVAIHDGVRPLVSAAMIARGLECAIENGSAVPTVGAVDSFRIVEDGVLRIVDRSLLRAVQTPQIFSASLLRRAYQRDAEERFTDDATVVEVMGEEMHYYEGERSNIKITTPEDLVIAKALQTGGTREIH